MSSGEIGSVVREGMRGNPIDVCDESDNEELVCDESVVESDKYSVEGMNEIENTSDFDVDVVVNERLKVFTNCDKPLLLISLRKKHQS